MEKFVFALAISIAILFVLRCVIRICSLIARSTIKRSYSIRVMGKCTRIDDGTYFRMGEIEKSIIPVFEVRINGKKKVVHATTSTVPCIVKKGDELELLVDPRSNRFIYSEEGLREYRRLKRQRNKYWWLPDLFFVIISTAFVSAGLMYFK